MGHHYTPSPPSEQMPMYSPPFKTPPDAPRMPQDESKPVTPSIPSNPVQNAPGGNGMPYCSGPQAPGWNVSTGKCDYNPVHAVVPPGQTATSVVQLSQLPYTGDSPDDASMSAVFYVLIIGLGISGIGLLLKYLQRQRV